MTARAAPSSSAVTVGEADRAKLRALARRLRPPTAPAAPAPAKIPAPYVRLRAAALTVPAPPAAATSPAPAPALPPPPGEVSGSAGWARLLGWCVDGLGARAVILTDDRGLVIAAAGSVDVDIAQGIAARLVIAFHQADRIGGAPSPAMAIQLEDGWLTGLRVGAGDDPLTVGVLADGPLAEAVRAAITLALTTKARAG